MRLRRPQGSCRNSGLGVKVGARLGVDGDMEATKDYVWFGRIWFSVRHGESNSNGNRAQRVG